MERRTGRDVNGSGRGLIGGTISALTRRDGVKSRKSSVIIALLWAKILNRDLPNMN
jgi:hypothetical protein